MSLEHDAFPQVTLFHDPDSFKLIGVKILFDDQTLSYEESSGQLDVFFSIAKGLQGLVVRDQIHPRRLWSALENAPHEVEIFVLRTLAPMFVEHNPADPLSRKYGPPQPTEAGQFGLLESDSPFWTTDSTLTAKRRSSKVKEHPPADPSSPRHSLKFPGK